MLKNIHEANLFQLITLRGLGAWSLAVTAIDSLADINPAYFLFQRFVTGPPIHIV